MIFFGTLEHLNTSHGSVRKHTRGRSVFNGCAAGRQSRRVLLLLLELKMLRAAIPKAKLGQLRLRWWVDQAFILTSLDIPIGVIVRL